MDVNWPAVVTILVAAVTGLVGWVWALWRSHIDLKIKVAEKYVNNDALGALRSEIHALRDVVYRIALKMDVPVFTEPYK